MKQINVQKNESFLKLFGLVFAGVFGSFFSYLILFFALLPISTYYHIWYTSTNKIWHYLLAFLTWYGGAYVLIKLLRKKTDNLANLLPLLSVGLFYYCLWLINFFIPS